MDPPEIAAQEFPTGVFGYEKGDVRGFLRQVADVFEERDDKIRELEHACARIDEAIALLSHGDRPVRRRAHPAVSERGDVIAEERAAPADER